MIARSRFKPLALLLVGVLPTSGWGAGPKGFTLPPPDIASINGGPCAYESVASAVEAASSLDTIIIAPGTYEALIGEIDKSLVLVPGRAASPGFTGCEAEDTTASFPDVVLSGAGGSDDSVGGLVHVLNGARVTFRNLTLESAVASNGGVLAITEASQVTLDGVSVENGTATLSGGLIYVEGGATASRLTLTGDTQLLNGLVSPGDGGGIALFDGQLTVEDARIGRVPTVFPPLFNTADGNGGGIFASNSTITLGTQARIIGNRAGDEGGGLYAINSTVTGDSANFAANRSERVGGGLAVRGGSVDLANAIFNMNETSQVASNAGGGAIHAGDDAVVTLDSVMFTENSAFSLGGAISLNAAQLYSVGSMFSQNETGRGGAVFSFESELTLEGGSLQNNAANSQGGALYLIGGSALIQGGVVFSENEADEGGGIFQLGASATELTLDNVTMDDNRATDSGGSRGGAILMGAGTLVISNSSFTGNEATGAGGAIDIDGETSGLTATIVGSQFLSNTAFNVVSPIGDGGAISATRLDQLNVTDTRFLNNSTDALGGALSLSRVASATFRNVRFAGNQSDRGGAISSQNSSFQFGVLPSNCDPFALASDEYCTMFSNNIASTTGGAIYVINNLAEGNINFNQVAFVDNQTMSLNETDAAVIEIRGTERSLTTMDNVLVADNGLPGSAAPALLVEGSQQLMLRHVTLAGNVASPLRAAEETAQVSVFSSILQLNGQGPGVGINVAYTGACNNSQPQQAGVPLGPNLGNPNFITTARGDYRLSAISVSVDQCEISSGRDLDGLFRISSNLADQGAFEQDGSVTPPDPLFADGFEGP